MNWMSSGVENTTKKKKNGMEKFPWDDYLSVLYFDLGVGTYSIALFLRFFYRINFRITE